ncbi:NADH dehydrogenase [ubiquinone] complex I, assembly factor 7 [Acrasis kona]|uniref:NADH dehydrogenase [ubiquinone] complex I, assembly factor 7 n=1 Tax=Acrasis kona TaxID=1008807 RepID=A0AAW2ZSP4_9EUKA
MKLVFYPRATFQFFSSVLKRIGQNAHHEKKALYGTVGLIGGSWTLLLLDNVFTHSRINSNAKSNRWHAFRNDTAQEEFERLQLFVSKEKQLRAQQALQGN